MSDRREEATALGQELLRARPEPSAWVLYLEALGAFIYNLSVHGGARQESSLFVARLLELCAEAAPEAPLERAWSSCAQGLFSFIFEARPWRARAWLEQACRGLFEVGQERNAIGAQIVWAQALEALGDRAGAEAGFRDSLARAQRLKLPSYVIYARLHLGQLLAGSAEQARREEALALASSLVLEGPNFCLGLAHAFKAKVAENEGSLAEAEAEARRACELLAPFPFHQRKAQTLRSRVLRAQGRAAEAREVAALGVQGLERSGNEGAEAVALCLTLAEACLAEGDTQAGEAALRRALRCLRTRAEDISDAAARERFLHQVPENARALELARQRWGTAEEP